ncbi:MAG: PorP/SprF family type IX secretion system membrane protein [Cyclobacteriaceae bacterium]|nr:PorP/SprF family type IX secretion system membrane protein [Cyclobacteriaceae bacterium]
MKKTLLIIFLCSLLSLSVVAQDIPLFTQKLTNSFIYNPALAGHTFGSLTYSYRQNYSNVPGAPQNHFLSMHTPFAKHKFGTGINMFQEDVNFIRNTYVSTAFAYHLRFSNYNILSMGVSGEYNISRLNGTSNTTAFETDPVLLQLQNGEPTFDYSFGVHYQTRYAKAGFAINRLSTAWINQEGTNLSNYHSGYVQGMIPVRGGEDLLEPYMAYRRFSETNDTYDIGLYYTFNNKILGGAAFRKGNVFNATLGFKPSKHLLIGYSREMITSSIGGFVGAANEITLRFDFNDQSYQERFRSDYKNSMAYRRKTLSPAAKYSARNPKQLSSKQKKLKPYSPNNRYQSVKKLSMNQKSKAPAKRKYTGKPDNRKTTVYKHKKRKPSRRR